MLQRRRVLLFCVVLFLCTSTSISAIGDAYLPLILAHFDLTLLPTRTPTSTATATATEARIPTHTWTPTLTATATRTPTVLLMHASY